LISVVHSIYPSFGIIMGGYHAADLLRCSFALAVMTKRNPTRANRAPPKCIRRIPVRIHRGERPSSSSTRRGTPYPHVTYFDTVHQNSIHCNRGIEWRPNGSVLPYRNYDPTRLRYGRCTASFVALAATAKAAFVAFNNVSQLSFTSVPFYLAPHGTCTSGATKDASLQPSRG
jgi:hypothetical protein